MFRKVVQLFNVDGKAEDVCDVDAVKKFSPEKLAGYQQNAQLAYKIYTAKLEKFELGLMKTFGYPSLEATRHGMKYYADGTAERQAKQLNDSMAQLRGILGLQQHPPQEENPEGKVLFNTMVETAKKYMVFVETGEFIKQQENILRSVMAEPQVVREQVRVCK